MTSFVHHSVEGGSVGVELPGGPTATSAYASVATPYGHDCSPPAPMRSERSARTTPRGLSGLWHALAGAFGVVQYFLLGAVVGSALFSFALEHLGSTNSPIEGFPSLDTPLLLGVLLGIALVSVLLSATRSTRSPQRAVGVPTGSVPASSSSSR